VRVQTGRSAPEILMTIDDRISAFLCASVRFLTIELKALKAHFDQ
jgi:hypothetical protein